MVEEWILNQIHHAIIRAYLEMSFYDFVENVLHHTPNENDLWQLEKWEDFQIMCKGLVRFSHEYFTRVIQLNST